MPAQCCSGLTNYRACNCNCSLWAPGRSPRLHRKPRQTARRDFDYPPKSRTFQLTPTLLSLRHWCRASGDGRGWCAACTHEDDFHSTRRGARSRPRSSNPRRTHTIHQRHFVRSASFPARQKHLAGVELGAKVVMRNGTIERCNSNSFYSQCSRRLALSLIGRPILPSHLLTSLFELRYRFCPF